MVLDTGSKNISRSNPDKGTRGSSSIPVKSSELYIYINKYSTNAYYELHYSQEWTGKPTAQKYRKTLSHCYHTTALPVVRCATNKAVGSEFCQVDLASLCILFTCSKSRCLLLNFLLFEGVQRAVEMYVSPSSARPRHFILPLPAR